MSWSNRFSNLWRGQSWCSEIDEEIEGHIAARTQENLKAGMTLDEARQDAKRRFGNATAVSERTREADVFIWLETFGKDVRYGLRSLRRNPTFTAVAIMALALGIGANTAVFTVVHGVLLRPLPFRNPGRLFLISHVPEHGPIVFEPGLSDRDYLEFEREERSFERIATFGPKPVTLTGAGNPFRLNGESVTPGFLPVLGVNPAIGRGFARHEGEPGRDKVVLLSDALWRSRFAADPKIIGKTITLDGDRYAVVGVMPRGLGFPNETELWLPLAVQLNSHNSYVRAVVGRLRNGVSPGVALAELEAFAAHWGRSFRRSEDVSRVIPLKELLVAHVRNFLLVFAGAVALVLLIACANVANLFLMRATARQHEMTVRAALGAGRGRLMRQMLTESLLVALGGGCAGILLAVGGVRALLALAPTGSIPRAESVRVDGTVLLFTLAIALLTGLVFGLAPAIRVNQNSSQGSGARFTLPYERLRGALVVAEISLALILLTGAGLLLKSFRRMSTVAPGFRVENMLTMTVDLPETNYRTAEQMKEFNRSVLDKVAALPGAMTAASVNWIPLGPNLVRGDFQLPGGRKLEPGYQVDKPVVSPNYFRAMGIRLLRGRDFSDRDTARNTAVVIVSQAVARQLWPDQDPVGKRLAMEDHPKDSDWLTIVGVVSDVRQQSLTEKPSPAVYQPYMQVSSRFFLSHLSFVIRTRGNPESLASGMRQVLRAVDRNQPVEAIGTMQHEIEVNISQPEFRTRLLGVFSLLALTLAAIGIYAVMANSVSQRSKEIGIRMALGANGSAVIRMVLLRTLLLTGFGLVLGALGALLASRALSKFLFDVKPNDPMTYGAVALVVVSLAIVSSIIPARRASQVDPLASLRHD